MTNSVSSTPGLSPAPAPREEKLNWTSWALLTASVVVQVAHLVCLLVMRHPVLVSNILQILAPFLPLGLCVRRAIKTKNKRQRALSIQLGVAFAIWITSQFFYTLPLTTPVTPRMGVCNFLWLLFAYPLLVASSSNAHHSHGRDLVSWLDAAQASLFFTMLMLLVFGGGHLDLTLAYDTQSLALMFAAGLQYSTAEGAEQRMYSRHVTVFVLIYGMADVIGYWGPQHGFPPGTIIDLCWSLPFTAYTIASLTFMRRLATNDAAPEGRGSPAQYMQAVSALGLAVMSMLASGAMAHHRPAVGVLGLALAFSLFAVRMNMREWQLQRAHGRLKEMAHHDALTGLANRTLLHSELSRRLAAAGTSGGCVGLLFIDLDRFKNVNDGLGHAAGDILLQRVAGLLSAAAGPGDMVARFGGDEFIIVTGSHGRNDVDSLAQRVLENLHAPVNIAGRPIHVTASIGVVMNCTLPGEAGAGTLSDGGVVTAESMIQDADCAMYTAKHMGKDQVQTFTPSMVEASRKQLALENDLRSALSGGSLEVAYQPIYSLSDKNIRGFEALARWKHSASSYISPEVFIPLAEETGLIVELGRQVLRESCRQVREWNDRFGVQLSANVNVSAFQFRQAGFMDEVLEIVQASGLAPRLLRLEVTESILLGGSEPVEQALQRARQAGIKVALDDFGTGYSSLSYLLHFPFDVIKIDKSFVRHLERDRRRAELVRMVIQLARMLRKSVVAEGVETEEEMRHLQGLGCEMVQGFLFSGPLPPGRAVELLEKAVGGQAEGVCQLKPSETTVEPATVRNQAPAAALFTAPGVKGLTGGPQPVHF